MNGALDAQRYKRDTRERGREREREGGGERDVVQVERSSRN